MKKVLFATTALVATASVAAADLNWSGGARFGVTYDEGRVDSTQVHNRFTLNFDGTADTDSGATFFARIRIRGENEGDGATSATTISAPRVGVTSGGFTLAVGNILGAVESTPGLYAGSIGLTGLSYGNVVANNSAAGRFSWDSFSSGGGGSNGVEVIYSMGDFSAHASYSGSTDRTAIHVAYSTSDWTFALAAQDSAVVGEDMVLFTAGGTLGSVDLGFAYGDIDGRDTAVISAGFEVGAGTDIQVYASSADGATDDAFGIGFTHSLGGATLAGGVAQELDGDTEADFGVRFNF